MNKNEKSIAANDALNNLTTEPKPKTRSLISMSNNTPNTSKFQPQTLTDAEFESMRLSRLPSLPKRNSYLNNQLEQTSEMEETTSLFGDVEQTTSLFGDAGMPRPESFTQNAAPPQVFDDICAGCNAWLDIDDQIQQAFSGCRDCLSIYGRLDAAFEENSKRKKKEILKRMAGGSK